MLNGMVLTIAFLQPPSRLTHTFFFPLSSSADSLVVVAPPYLPHLASKVTEMLHPITCVERLGGGEKGQREEKHCLFHEMEVSARDASG